MFESCKVTSKRKSARSRSRFLKLDVFTWWLQDGIESGSNMFSWWDLVFDNENRCRFKFYGWDTEEWNSCVRKHQFQSSMWSWLNQACLRESVLIQVYGAGKQKELLPGKKPVGQVISKATWLQPNSIFNIIPLQREDLDSAWWQKGRNKH